MQASVKYPTGNTFGISLTAPVTKAEAFRDSVHVWATAGAPTTAVAWGIHCNRKEALVIAHSILLALADSGE